MKSRPIGTLIAVAFLIQSVALLAPTARVEMTPLALASNSPSKATAPPSDKETRMRISKAYGKLPLRFEQNQGQADRKVKFLSLGANHALLLTPTEAVLSLQSEKPTQSDSEKRRPEKRELQSEVLRMRLVGANTSPKIAGRDQLRGKSNYLIGDKTKWHTNIPNYAKVQYNGVYPGINLVYYGNQRRLEYDFVVAPGADPHAIHLSFDVADELKLDADGTLRLKMKGGDVTQPAPVIYQKTQSGERQQVAGRYVLKGDNNVVFELAEYDRTRELVIDPQLLYATFYGGSGDDRGEDIAVDGSGNAYITGSTTSSNLILKSAADGNFGGPFEAFVIKLFPDGSDFFYATYLGGSFNDSGKAIAVTSDGKACVTGSTQNSGNNSDFPTTPSRFQGNGFGIISRGLDCFVTVLTPAGNDLSYSTFFAGDGVDSGNGIAVDATNKIYIVGETFAENLPTKNAFQNNRAGFGSGRDAFIAKFDPSQSGNSSLIYSSFLGGSNGDIAGDFAEDIAVTPAGVAFMVGSTDAANFPTKSSSSLPPFQTTHRGLEDAFIAKVSPSGALIYATLFGGNSTDHALGVAVDSEERAYVTGFTLSSAATFPLKNAFQPNRIGSAQDAFVAKFNADGTTLFYSSFLGGGTINNSGLGIAVDAGGNAYVTGQSVTFNDSSTVNGFPSSVPNNGGLVAKIEASDATGTTIPKILYMDGFSTVGNGIGLDPRGNVYIVGSNSGSFTTTPGAFQETYNGGPNDATVVKIRSTFPDTIGVFHPPGGLRPVDDFQLRNSNTPGPPNLIVDFGQAGDQPLAGDWDGNGVDDVGVYRPSTAQFLLRQPTLLFGVIFPATRTINFGLTGDKAIVGDWDGDGIDTIGVFRNGTFLLTNSPNVSGSSPPADLNFAFGTPTIATDLPVAGDWNGDGIDTIGVFRGGANGEWFLRNSNSTGAADLHLVQFGIVPGVLPVVGDWNGDGVDTIGLFLNGTFFFRNTNTSGPGTDLTFNSFAEAGDIALSGDWDGKPGNTPPDSGVNNPSGGASRPGQTQVFTTTCSDPDGWRDIHTIDFKITRSNGDGQGVPVALWVQFDQNQNLIRLYDPDLQTWREGAPGSSLVLENGYVQLNLAGTRVQGSGPLGPSVQISWELVFKNPAAGKNYKQYLRITDDTGASTGFDHVGSWSVLK